jgi:hypothetical protein
MVQLEHRFCTKLDILETKFDMAMPTNKNFAIAAIFAMIAVFMTLWMR